MKTQIIQIEAHDDAISTRDKMEWSQAGRILLVWPERGRVLASRLDLMLVQRRSHALGVQLALVTCDSEVRFHAQQLGIQTFKSIRQAQESRWRHMIRPRDKDRLAEAAPRRLADGQLERPRRETIPPPTPVRLIFFALGVLALFSIAAVLVPSAKIRLVPQIRSQEVSITVEASKRAKEIGRSGQLPISPLSVMVEGQDEQTTSGSLDVPDKAAGGQVVFTNLTDRSISVPAGTVVSDLSSTQRFTVDKQGTVPAGPGQTLSLPITALQPGSGGNMPAGAIQAIEGPLGLALSVANVAPTTGGTDLASPAPTDRNRRQLRSRLEATLRQSAMEEIRSGLDQNDVLLDDQLGEPKVLEEIFDPQGLEPASHVRLRMRLEYLASSIRAADQQALATSILDANLPEGYLPVPGSLQVETISAPQWIDSSTARWRIRASRSIQAQISDDQAAQLSMGLAPAQAGHQLMDALPLAEAPRIFLFPSWWPRLPLLPFRITISDDAVGGSTQP